MRGSTAAKSVVGWRYAPACCAAQSVHRARRRSAVLKFEPVPFPKAIVALPVKGNQAWQEVFAQLKHRSHRNDLRPTQEVLALCRPCKSNGSWLQEPYFYPHQCCLTGRSTGPIAAVQHLGYKSLAQIPARHNRPVSYDVRPHRGKWWRYQHLRRQEQPKVIPGQFPKPFKLTAKAR